MTLKEARDKLRELVYDGHQCPCCRQWAQVYRWSLYSTAAHALILFYREGGIRDYVHSKRLKELGHKGQGDAARLRLWGLVERDESPREDGGKSGWWRVTQTGERFVLNKATISKYVWVYNGRLLNTDGPQISIVQALGKNFNYAEMMAGVM